MQTIKITLEVEGIVKEFWVAEVSKEEQSKVTATISNLIKNY